jgi:hypothetical protein
VPAHVDSPTTLPALAFGVMNLFWVARSAFGSLTGEQTVDVNETLFGWLGTGPSAAYSGTTGRTKLRQIHCGI